MTDTMFRLLQFVTVTIIIPIVLIGAHYIRCFFKQCAELGEYLALEGTYSQGLADWDEQGGSDSDVN